MATIKDVAKLAEVSIGTVSNVINGKTQNEVLIERVEQAMGQLDFRPGANARSLKSTKSRLIGILLPNALQSDGMAFLHTAEALLREKGFSVLVKFSGNNHILERKCIESFIEHCVEGMLLYLTAGRKAIELLNSQQIPAVLITRNNAQDFSGDKIVIDYADAFEQMMEKLAQSGCSSPALVMEHELLKADELLSIYERTGGRKDLVKIVDCSKEHGFKAFFELFSADKSVDGVIASNHIIAQGIRKALKALGISEFPVAVFKESNWIEDMDDWFCQISVSQKLVAQNGARMLLEALEEPNLHEQTTKIIPAKYDEISSILLGIQKSAKTLRFAMYDCPSARSLEMMTQIYERESGTRVVFDMFSYEDLEKLLYRKLKNRQCEYDGFMMDIIWLEEMVETGSVRNLDWLREEKREYFDGFIDGVLRNFAMYYESLYGIPFVSGAQLLFYQKDLFEDQLLKIRFKRKYGTELTPPRTWAQFNLVAEFFTQSYTPQSPVRYGISLVKGENISLTCGFLTHLWAYDSSVFGEKGNVILNNSNAETALKNFVQSYRYTSPRKLSTWNEIAEEFRSGETAMLVLYDSDAGSMTDYTRSKVAGNLGCGLIPGGTPVLGGWNLGLNRYGKAQKETMDFILWACGAQNGIPLSLLGGSTLQKEYYDRNDLENLEPWKPYILKSYKQSRKRVMPELLDDSRYKNTIYTTIIPRQLMKVLNGEITEKEALKNMEERIGKLLELQ